MPSVLEFDFRGDQGGPEDGDQLGGRSPRRVPAWAWIVAGVLVLVVAVGVQVGRRDSARPVPIAAADLQDQLRSVAVGPSSSGGVIKPGSFGCPQIRTGFPPTSTQLGAIESAFPSFGTVDSTPVIDGSSGLCSIAFRALDATGAILVVVVTAPPNPPSPSAAASAVPAVLVQPGRGGFSSFLGDEYTSPGGFRIQVGAFTAAGRSAVSAQQVTSLIRNPALTW